MPAKGSKSKYRSKQKLAHYSIRVTGSGSVRTIVGVWCKCGRRVEFNIRVGMVDFNTGDFLRIRYEDCGKRPTRTKCMGCHRDYSLSPRVFRQVGEIVNKEVPGSQRPWHHYTPFDMVQKVHRSIDITNHYL